MAWGSRIITKAQCYTFSIFIPIYRHNAFHGIALLCSMCHSKESTFMVPFPSSHGKQELTAQPLLDMIYAFARTAMLLAAVRLHLFTLLAERAQAPAELAAAAH